ncbi:MAG: hypothetical protein WAW59_02030 [Patescibacteria group bacterium]
MTEKGVILDSITKTIRILDIPILESVSRTAGILTGATLSLPLTPLSSDIDTKNSRIVMDIARGPLRNPTQAIARLINYPYGCIEQTVSSTLPNAIALKYASVLGLDIDKATAEKNLTDGLTKILRMQSYG